MDYIQNPENVLPTLAGLSLHLGVGLSTLEAWKAKQIQDLDPEKYPRFDEFQGVLGVLEATQHDKLIQNGLSGKHNSNITKLLLTKHGYTDQNKTVHEAGDRMAALMGEIGSKPDVLVSGE